MREFFLLSRTGRLKRGDYFFNMLGVEIVSGLASELISIDKMPYWVIIILLLISIGWAIYAISARIHDFGYPGWIAWIRLLQILPIILEGSEPFVSLVCLCFGLILLFIKGLECDLVYGPNPYVKDGGSADNKENIEDTENKSRIRRKNTEQKEKKVVKTKTAKSKKNK